MCSLHIIHIVQLEIKGVLMLKVRTLIVIAAVSAVCLSNAQSGKQTTVNPSERFKEHFEALGTEGSIVIVDVNSQQSYQYNVSRNRKLFRPASSFKIFNSLVALESGAVADELELLTWDGIKRGPPGTPNLTSWNRDLNLKEAYHASAIWFYQVLARRAGHDAMREFIQKANFGNVRIGPPDDLDSFWLDGELRISPMQYIAFLKDLIDDSLPFSKETVSLVKDVMIVEQTPDYTLRGKTGWDWESTPHVGWFVGYLEQAGNTYLFALTLDLVGLEQLPARVELVRDCLEDLGLL